MWRSLVLKILLVISVWAGAPRESFWRDINRIKTGLINPWEDPDAEDFDKYNNSLIKSIPTHTAWTNMYVQSGGNNAYAGTSTTLIWGNASTTWTGSTTGTIVVTDATASAVTVGDWINVGGSFISPVTAVSNAGSAYTITLSHTAGTYYGVEPSSGTLAAYDGGPWANLSGTIITSSSSYTVPVSTLINVKYATYTLGATLNIYLKGTTTAPLQISGYTSTPGDLTSVTTTSNSYPLFSGSYEILSKSAYFRVTGLSFTCSGAFPTVSNNGATGTQTYDNCRFVNTYGTASGVAFQIYSFFSAFTNCYFNAESGSGNCAVVEFSASFMGCWFTSNSGNSKSGLESTSGDVSCQNCVFVSLGAQAIYAGSTGALSIKNCTFSNCGNDAIYIAAIPGTSLDHIIANNLFRNITGYGINNATGTNTAVLIVQNNAYYNCSSGHTNGFGDWNEINPITLSSDPCVSNSNLTLVSTSPAAGAGMPGQWQNVSEVSYPDIGAFQRNASSGGGTVVPGPYPGGVW